MLRVNSDDRATINARIDAVKLTLGDFNAQAETAIDAEKRIDLVQQLNLLEDQLSLVKGRT